MHSTLLGGKLKLAEIWVNKKFDFLSKWITMDVKVKWKNVQKEGLPKSPSPPVVLPQIQSKKRFNDEKHTSCILYFF